MSAGPATKMHTALLAIAETNDGSPGHQADRALRDIIPAMLEAMDAAAEAISVRHPDESNWPLRIDDGSRTVGITDYRGETFLLSPAEETQLLRHFLQRAIKRRKEAGNG